MKRFLVFASVLFVMSATPSMAQISAESPKRGGTLTMAIRKDLTMMNPLVRTSSTDHSIREVMYESLLAIDLRGNLRPHLAESWELSNDGKLITFQLRKGVKFHDGREMTARDAKFAMDYTMNPKNGAYGFSRLAIVDRVEAPDRHTLKIYLEKPSPAVLYSLGTIKGFSVVPAGSLEEGISKPAKYPPGTGAFRFVEWKPRQMLVLERNGQYWGEKALVDRVVLRPITDATIRLTALRAGDVDLIEATPWEWARQIMDRKLPGIKLAEAPHGGFRILTFNVPGPPFNDKRLRQAVAYALNKKEILEASYFGFGEPADQRYPKGHLWHFEEVRSPTYNPERAKALLKEAGYKGETLELNLRQGEQETEGATIHAQLSRIGMNVKLVPEDYSAYVARQRSGEFHFRPGGGSMDPDPSPTYAPNYACEPDLKKRASNTAGYCDKEMDALIEKAETEIDPEKRRELVRRIVQKAAEDLPELPIGFVPRFFAFRDYVKGFRAEPEGRFWFPGGGVTHAWLDK